MLREDGRFDPVQSRSSLASLTQLSPLSGTDNAPDVILAETNHFPAIGAAIDESATLPIVLMTDVENRSQLVQALHNGVRGVVRRDSRPEEIFAALEAASAGLTALGPNELDLIAPVVASVAHEDTPALDALSQRELEVLALVAQGLANKIISDRLGISEHTVKFHISSILSKLGASSRTEAVTKGLRDGLLVI